VRNLHDLFPNLRLCYLSSRTYGGYNNGHTEPVSYEGGFAVKWLIEDQIGGDPQLEWDASAGPVEAPLLLWGPYLWADGQTPRSDGLTWCASDFEGDGTHPSPAGEQKVATMLSSFFASDATAQPWFANPGLDPLVAIDAHADASVDSAQPNTNFGSDPTLFLETTPDTARAYVRFDVSAVPRPVVHAKLSLRNTANMAFIASLAVRQTATAWTESTITFNNAPMPIPPLLSMPSTSRDGARSLDVTDWVNADADGVISLVLVAGPPGGPTSLMHSREGGWAPRLVLSTRPGAWVEYCAGGTTSSGCVPSMSASGVPSIASASGFVLSASQLEGSKTGLIFYGISGRLMNPWGASYLCVKAPVQRTGNALTGGTNGQCDGALALDWLAYLASQPGALGSPFAAGQVVDAQCWFRDPPSAKTTSLSEALEFTTCP
jgi:hypothetical protein